MKILNAPSFTENNFLSSQDLTNTLVWSSIGGGTVTGGQTDPLGNNNAQKLTLSGASDQYVQGSSVLIDESLDQTISLWIRADSPVNFFVLVGDASDGVPSYAYITPVTTAWQRISYQFTQTT